MKHVVALVAATLAVACASHAAPRAAPPSVARGRAIVEQHCSSCHAVGRHGDSPAPEAPALRTLSQNYRVEALEEAFAEGISVGHPAMPHFAFEPDDVSALIAYLQSVQDESQGDLR